MDALLSRTKNPFFEHAEAEYFLAERDGEVVGRIAAISNRLHNETHEDRVGFFGFFECDRRPGRGRRALRRRGRLVPGERATTCCGARRRSR